MRRFVLIAAILVVIGGIYQDEILDTVDDLTSGSGGGGGSTVSSLRDMGSSGRSLLNEAGNALGR